MQSPGDAIGRRHATATGWRLRRWCVWAPPARTRCERRRGGRCCCRWAVAWQVTESTGAALGHVVARLGDAARADVRHRRAVDAELAAVRASTRLLGALPAVGLLMGTALGADPVRFLLGTEAGRCCLLGGGLLEWAGCGGPTRIADRAGAGR